VHISHRARITAAIGFEVPVLANTTRASRYICGCSPRRLLPHPTATTSDNRAVDDATQPWSSNIEERRVHLEESERQARAVVEMLQSTLDDPALAVILNLIDHNEPGVALEFIFDYLVDRQVSPPSGVGRAVQALAARMSMTSREWEALSDTTASR